MALIVLTSAAGSPGVTTTSLGLAIAWPRPALLVEADPAGSSAILAGYFQGRQEPTGGLIDLALAQRTGTVAESLSAVTRQLSGTGVGFVAGTRSHEQARSLVGLWEPLTAALRGLDRNGVDVIVDAGRLGLASWPEPLVYGGDLTLVLTRSTLPALAGARSWAKTLSAGFERGGALSSLGVLLVDDAARWSGRGHPVPRVRPYTARQVAKALALPVVASVAWDPAAADVYTHGARPPRKFDTSPLVRSYRSTAVAILSVLAGNAEDLAATGSKAGQW